MLQLIACVYQISEYSLRNTVCANKGADCTVIYNNVKFPLSTLKFMSYKSASLNLLFYLVMLLNSTMYVQNLFLVQEGCQLWLNNHLSHVNQIKENTDRVLGNKILVLARPCVTMGSYLNHRASDSSFIKYGGRGQTVYKCFSIQNIWHF